MLSRLFQSVIISFLSLLANAQGNAGYVCPRCGHFEWKADAMKNHTCTYHHFNCPNSSAPAPYIPTKSPEQIRKEREKKDLQEAAEDANEQGVDYYEKEDWATAINYFKIALEYVPDYDDAAYNLKKAEDKLRLQKIKDEEAKRLPPEEQVKTVVISDRIQKYMDEADHIVVPPPSWESSIQERSEQLRLNQDGDKNLWIANDIFLAAFDESSTLTNSEMIQFKLLVIGVRSTIASENEADLVLFKQTAWYELALRILKDKKQGPELIAAIKALKEKKAIQQGTNPEIIRLAKATQDPSLGNSSVHIAMNAMLSSESMAAFYETAKMEVKSMVSDKINGAVGDMVSARFGALKDLNDKITTLQGIADKEQEPLLQTVLRTKISELGKKMESAITIPKEVTDMLGLFKK